MRSIDYVEVLELLEIAEKASPALHPRLKPIFDRAMIRLEEIAQDARESWANDPLNKSRVVTPPDGPGNSAISNPDGTYSRFPQMPTRMEFETDKEYQARVDLAMKNVPRTQPKPLAIRPNERPMEESVTKTDTEKTAEMEREVDEANRPTDPYVSTNHVTEPTRRV